MTSLAANYSNAAADPFTRLIAIAQTSSPEVLAIGIGGVIGALFFIVMVAVYFAAGRGKSALPVATYEGFAFSPSPSPPPPSLSIPPYPVGPRAAISYEAPDPVGVFRTIADPDAAVIETGPMSAVVISSKPGSDLAEDDDDGVGVDDFKTTIDGDFFDDGRTIVGLGTYSEELAEELALHASWQEARRAELLATDSSPLITVLGEEDLDLDEAVTPQIISRELTKKRPKIRRISPTGPRYENHP
jgi:hypothetical protein